MHKITTGGNLVGLEVDQVPLGASSVEQPPSRRNGASNSRLHFVFTETHSWYSIMSVPSGM